MKFELLSKTACMKSELLLFIMRLLFITGAIVSIFQIPLLIQTSYSQTPDAYIKIRHPDKILKLIDQAAISAPSKNVPASSPGTTLKDLLHGTDWIDPSQSIIMGITFVSVRPGIFIFIPFVKPNENFETSYNAIKGSDYYIISLSSGQQKSIADQEMLTALKNAAQSKAEALISIDIEVKRMMDGRYAQIRRLIRNMPLSSGDSTANAMLTPAEIRMTLFTMLDKIKQLERITANTDFDGRILKTALKLRAIEGSEVAQLFASGGSQSFLQNYLPEAQIRFQSQSFDVNGMIQLLNACFGTVDAKAGADFDNILKISSYFTGETAGGIIYNRNQMLFEMISVFKDRPQAKNFTETIFLPWLSEYSRNMSQILETKRGGRARPVYTRTLDSTVNGHKVAGFKGQWSVPEYIGGPNTGQTENTGVSWMKYRMRITTHDNFLIIAPNDNRLKHLIRLVNTFKKQPADKTRLVNMTIDLNGCLEQMNRLGQQSNDAGRSLKKMGAMQIELNLQDREAVFTSLMRIQDIRTMATCFNTQPVSKNKRLSVKQKSLVPMVPPTQKKPRPSNTDVKKTGYWLDKGLICATYGNDLTAIMYFKKALELSPQRGDIWFTQGISYGETGNFTEALLSLNKALKAGFSEGLGLYGRARIYLLAGETSKAMEDFRQAADLGNSDAINYLEKKGEE